MQGVQGVVDPAVVEESSPELTCVSVECMKVQPGGKYVLAVLSNGAVRFWNTERKVLRYSVCTGATKGTPLPCYAALMLARGCHVHAWLVPSAWSCL
jgi:hypothetical protein